MHNITHTSVLHLPLPFQAINFSQKILTLSFQDCATKVTLFRGKRVQSRVGSGLHKNNSLSQVVEQGGIVQMMRTNDVKFLGQVKVYCCDHFTFLGASMSAVDKNPMFNRMTYNCTYVVV